MAEKENAMKLHVVGLTTLGMFLTTLSAPAQNANDREWTGAPYHDAQLTGVSLTKAEIQRMLPSGKLRVDVVDFAIPPKRIQDIGNKMSASIAKHRRWKQAHAEELTRDNELPPFSPELGLTQLEYAELAGFLRTGVKLVKRGEGVVTVQADGDTIDLEGQANTSLLTNIQIHLTENKVSTPYGTLKIVPPQKPKAHPHAGSLNGTQWERMTGTPAKLLTPPVNTSSASLVVGKNLDGKSGVLKYSAVKFVNGRQVYGTMLIVQFPLNNTPTK